MIQRLDTAVIGEVYIDHVFSGFRDWPGPGEEVTTEEYMREMGGGAVTTACGLARLGRSVGLVGSVSADDLEWFGKRLANFGLSSVGLQSANAETGITISVSTPKDRSFFTYVGANRGVEDLAVKAGLPVLLSARHVHFAMPVSQSLADQILPRLFAAQISTSLDVGYRPEWIADRANLVTLTAFDYVMFNEKEAALLCGSDDIAAFFHHATEIGIKHPMVKLGAQGAAALADNQIVRVPPPPIAAVDATGAGDVFDAGFIHGLLNGDDTISRLRFGCIAGALSTRQPGALAAIPDQQELLTVYERNY